MLVGASALAALVGLGTLGITLGDRSTPLMISVKNVATSTISTTSQFFTTPPPAPPAGPPAPAGASTTTSAAATTSTSTTPPAPPPPTPLDNLYSVLPPGYNSTLCGPSATPAPQALATVDCRQLNADGPSSARFSLFADANTLASQFQSGVNDSAVSQCPGSIDSPRSWHYDATPAFSAGSLVCGTRNNVPDLMWTKNDALLLGDVQGSSLDSLYGWWLSLG